MTHSPPVPAGNQSPYPLQEPPHQAAEPLPPVRHDEAPTIPAGTIIGAAVVAGIGAAAAAGAYFLSFRKQKAKPKRRRAAAKKKD